MTTARPRSSTAGASAKTLQAPTCTARSTKRSRRSASRRAECERGSELDELLVRLQRELFVVGAELATAPENRSKLEPGVSLTTAEMVMALEPIIDDITARYEAPKEFVLPGENRVAAALDVARTVVRRAERQSVAAANAGWLADSSVVPYLNRLADLVYTLARWQEGTFRPVPSIRLLTTGREHLRSSRVLSSPSSPHPPIASPPSCSRCRS